MARILEIFVSGKAYTDQAQLLKLTGPGSKIQVEWSIYSSAPYFLLPLSIIPKLDPMDGLTDDACMDPRQ